jgi:anthranilate/para-aminobenzoate synthase component II
MEKHPKSVITTRMFLRTCPRNFQPPVTTSLVIERDTLPDCLEITATSEDHEIMGIRHRELPVWGVQFHPESLATENGIIILKNFLDLC